MSRIDAKEDAPLHDNDRDTLWLAGCPYHWDNKGGWLQLRKGFAPLDPDAQNTSEEYLRWVNS